MATWRDLRPEDIEALMHVGDVVHPGLPETRQVFEERIRLYQDGCLALVDNDGAVCGYAISHPIRQRQPPALNSMLGEVAPDADQYYIHDVAILPGLRGRQHARQCIDQLLIVARRYPTACLISVYGTQMFWERFGFNADKNDDETMKQKLAAYGDDATYMVRFMV